MDPTVFEMALTAVHDALAIGGPNSTGGYMRTSDPAQHMSQERLRLARAVLKSLPPGTTATTAEAVAQKMVPLIRAILHK
jgi:hypothetical protein